MTEQPSPFDTIETAARRCAEARRVMMGAWDHLQIGRGFALDLMGIEPEQLGNEHVTFADLIRFTNRDRLAAADLFLADTDMVDLLDTAAPTMPDQELDLRDLLEPHGFLYFAKPLPDQSGEPPFVPIHALSWTVIEADHPLLFEKANGHPHVLLNSYVKTLEHAQAELTLQGRLKEGETVALAPGAPGLTPNSSVMWSEGSLIGEVYGEVSPEGSTPGFYQRVIAAFWTLARQPLTETTQTPAGARPDRRRSARAGVKEPNKPVHVIRLRPRPGGHAGIDPAPSGESGRKVGVRFITRGFWRNQWLPSTESHRQQYIAPHWRGPEGAPIKGGERVFLAEGKPRQPAPGKDDSKA